MVPFVVLAEKWWQRSYVELWPCEDFAFDVVVVVDVRWDCVALVHFAEASGPVVPHDVC